MPLTEAQIAFIDLYIADFTADLDAIPIEGTEEDKKLITALRALKDKIDAAIDANPALNYGVRDLITAVRRDHNSGSGRDRRGRRGSPKPEIHRHSGVSGRNAASRHV